MDIRKFGYARVSSTGQKLDRQILQLQEYVPKENIVVDKESGKNLDRPGYQALKSCLGLRENDWLYITSLDRLSRKKQDIKTELEWFKEHGVRLIVLDLPTTLIQIPEGQDWILEMINNVLIEVLSSIAEQERKAIKSRQKQGLDAARRQGKRLGRPGLAVSMKDFEPIYQEWKSGRITAKDGMRKLGISSSSFYRLIKEYETDIQSKSASKSS